MSVTCRSTLVVHGRLATQEGRLSAARERRHGVQVVTFEQAAARLAGGFTKPIDDESLRAAIQTVLPTTPMGELESIKLLPGMIRAAADTLHKAWRAGIDLTVRSADHPRLDAIARLETAVLAQLPDGMMRPLDIVAAANRRISHAPAVLGAIEIVGLTELSPCWRPLLKALAVRIPVRWTAGPRSVPPWIDDSGVLIVRGDAEAPTVVSVCAATAYHEAIEAMRWTRALLASGVSSSDIASPRPRRRTTTIISWRCEPMPISTYTSFTAFGPQRRRKDRRLQRWRTSLSAGSRSRDYAALPHCAATPRAWLRSPKAGCGFCPAMRHCPH